jgi:hypothetical protein
MSASEGETTPSEEGGGWTARSGLTAEQTDKLDAFRARLFRDTPHATGSEDDLARKEGKAKHSKKKKKSKAAAGGDEEEKIDGDDAKATDEAELTEEQRQWLDDMCLCRYLRARDWDLDKAEVPPLFSLFDLIFISNLINS